MRRMMRRTGAMLAALSLAACSGNPPGGEMVDGEGVRITVENDGTIPTQARIYLVPESGSEINVGRMSTLGAETLTVPGPLRSGQYRLRAEGGTDYRRISPVFQLRPGDAIVWEMQRNVVQRP